MLISGAVMIEKPDFILNFHKPENTEIKHIRGHWYLYERHNKYDPSIKRSRKVSGKCLGKITTQGLIPTKRRLVNIEQKPQISDVIEVGSSVFFYERTAEYRERLQKFFPDLWRQIYVISFIRAMYNPRFRRLFLHYENSFFAHLFPDLNFSAPYLCRLLKSLGKQRDAIAAFMREDIDLKRSFILFDGHRLLSASRTMEFAELGYDSKRRFKPQINLLYLFSLSEDTGLPLYYKQYIGSTHDVRAFADILKEVGIKSNHYTIIADKGFGSDEDFALLEHYKLNYLIPLKRGNRYVKDRIPLSQSDYDSVFTYHGRAIQCKRFDEDDCVIHLYYDAQLYADELSDASLRLEKLNAAKELKTAQELKRRSHNKGRLTDAELAALKPQTSAQLHAEIKEMGTITVRTNQSGLNGKQIYYMYKQRQAIEQYFKTYGDTMEFESSYMRGRNEEEAWLFLNHLSSVFAIGCIEEIAGIEESRNISLKDLTQTLSKITAVKIDGQWKTAPIKRTVEKLCRKLDLNLTDEYINSLVCH